MENLLVALVHAVLKVRRPVDNLVLHDAVTIAGQSLQQLHKDDLGRDGVGQQLVQSAAHLQWEISIMSIPNIVQT